MTSGLAFALLLVALPLGILPTAQAAHVTSVETHDFELDPRPAGGLITTRYGGYYYTGVLECTNTNCVVVDPTNVFNVWILHDRRVLSFEATFFANAGITSDILINGYDRAGVLVAQNDNCAPSVGGSTVCKVEAHTWELGRIQIVATPGTWAYDNARYGITNQPLINTIGTSSPGEAFGHSEPAHSTPDVPPTSGSTPPVVVPSPCTLDPCATPTVVPSQTVDPDPIPPIVIQEIPKQTIGPLEVGPVPGRTVFGGFDQGPVSSPSVTAPAFCDVIPDLCIPSIQLVGPVSYSLPGQAPVGLTPPVSVSVVTGTLSGEVTPYIGYFGTLQPISVEVAGVPVTLCANGTCSGLIPPNFEAEWYIRVTVQVGSFTFSEDVQPQVSF